MTRPRIAVASLGGTITMVPAGKSSSVVVPTLTVDDLLLTAPALLELAELSAETLATVPGASLGFRDVLNALEWATREVEQGASGVVLVQGTDTIEETAYLIDLHWGRSEPIVVTGAMKAPAAGSDGPANLLAAVQVAIAPASRGLGCLVVMHDEVHAAARVKKTRSSGVGAFSSPGFGPIAYVEEGRVVFGNQPASWPHLTPSAASVFPRIALLETCLDDDASLLDLTVEAGFDGIVLAGFGVGHVSRTVAEAVTRAVERCPVVLASRTGSGTTFAHTYGFVGSESDLLSRGAIPAGWLDPRKARILLSSLLSTGSNLATIRMEFDSRGALSSALPVSDR
jgi:L-asparaginase